ncbi:MAG: sugar-binding protein [Armatimonadota bacterium]
MRTPLLVVLLSISLATCTVASAERQITVPFVPQGPALRGDLSDPLWQQAAKPSDFVAADGISKPAAATEAFILADAQALYVGFVCHEPNITQIAGFANDRDGQVWSDDCVEFTLDPARGRYAMYHFIVNSKGTMWDGINTPGRTDASYASGATARGAVGTGRWTCELRIPWGDVSGKPDFAEIWGMNFCRERKTDNEEITSWSPAYNNFTDAQYLGSARFSPVPLSRLAATHISRPFWVESRGAVAGEANDTGLNALIITPTDQASWLAHKNLLLTVRAGDRVVASKTILPREFEQIKLPYMVPAEGAPVITFAVSADRKPLYTSRLTAIAPQAALARSWVTPDPLYQELLSKKGPGLCSQGCIMWSHATMASPLQEVAKRFATRYVHEEAYAEYAKYGSKLISRGLITGLPLHYFQKYKLQNLASAASHAPDSPWCIDPASTQNALREYKEMLSQPHPQLWGIFAGDELDEQALSEGASLMVKHPDGYEYIHQADREVKEQFGGGKWGIPEGKTEKNPYRWIAFRRWCLSQLRDRHRLLREMVNQYDPKVLLISTDPMGSIVPLEFSSQGPLFDIFTQQWAPRKTQWRAQLGCITKITADLTGKEAWPCAHVENYTMDPTPQEVVEEMSQVFRNGGSGFHLYMPDTGNGPKAAGDTRLCYWGSPRRYQTIMNIVDHCRTMPRLNLPQDTRTAILFNDDTLSGEHHGGSAGSSATEACYTFLGPVARSWFKFIDCHQVITWPSLRERFSVIYVPVARYQRPAVVEKLTQFVREGGTLICGDADAFETDHLGNDTTAARKTLFGVTLGEVRTVNKLIPVNASLPEVAVKSDVRQLVPVANTVKILAKWDEGSVAVSSNQLGKGRAILFARNPFVLTAVPEQQWREFFTALVKWTAQPTGLSIWRFQFPDSVIHKDPVPAGYCLTNNHARWQDEKPRFERDREIGATYQYSLAPDLMTDIAVAGGNIPGSQGRLTDRRESIMAKKAKAANYAPFELPASRWMVSWKQTAPVSITYDLRQPWALRALKLWFTDTMPDLTVEGSVDRQEWVSLGKHVGKQAGADVYDMEVPLQQSKPSRYVRVNFAERNGTSRLSLIETELWGDEVRP